MNTLYRIFTQNKNKKYICQLVSESVDGFTIYETIGFWQGKKEKALCIEIMTDNALAINQICKAVCVYNCQTAVLIEKIDCEVQFISVSGKI